MSTDVVLTLNWALVASQFPLSSLIGNGPSLVNPSSSSSLLQDKFKETNPIKKIYINFFMAISFVK
jgi:hypothetical protein